MKSKAVVTIVGGLVAGGFGLAGPAWGQEKISEGMLQATGPDGQSLGPCPLEHTDVDVRITGFVARVEVTQKFHNPFDYKIEGVYVFPLSQNAAVDDMTMTVGERVIRGVIKPREEARQIYEDAKAAGHVASLLEQDRPNIFTQSVANIEPGARVEIRIAYVETLDWEDGTYTFDFPMVVGPRYMPGASTAPPVMLPAGLQPLRGDVLKSRQVVEFVLQDAAANTGQRTALSEEQARACLLHAALVQKPETWHYAPWHPFTITYADGTTEDGDFYLDGQLGRIGDRYFAYDPAAPIPQGTGWAIDTDQVPDASRISPPVVPEGMRAGHDISISVDILAGFPLLDVQSVQHAVDLEYTDAAKSQAIVKLQDKKAIPNKDFVLKYTTTTKDIGDTLLPYFDARGGFFTLILQPPQQVPPEWIVPKEMIFVIDKSGSMSGFPIETAKKTMALCIENLNPKDTFNLMTFEGGVGFCFPGPVPDTPENRAKAQEYLASLEGSGGTEMMKAIEACLADQHDAQRVRIVCFMTDGYVGNDMAIIEAVQRNAGTARVFSFGIGRSVNRFLLDGLANAGRGDVEHVLDETRAGAAAQKFYDRVSTPVLTDIEIDWGGLPVEEVLPARIPDLFSAKPVVVKGRYTGAASGVITLRGQRGTEGFERQISVDLPGESKRSEVIATLWAREKVEHLMNQNLAGIQQGQPDPQIKQAIVDLGLAYRLLTQFTSFVAVEEMTITRGGEPVKVTVPVEMPEGVSHEGVFGAEGARAGGMVMYSRVVPRKRDAAAKGVASLGYTAAAPVASELQLGVRAEDVDFDAFADARASRSPEAYEAFLKMMDTMEKEGKLKPEEKRERLLKVKLAPELQGLAGKVKEDGSFSEGKVQVKDGRIEVTVYLADASEATMKKLAELGFTVILKPQSANMVIGSIEVKKLEELALLKEVRRVQLAMYSESK